MNMRQWRIQDFPEGGANSKSDDVIPFLRQISRSFMKIRVLNKVGNVGNRQNNFRKNVASSGD